MPTMISAPVQPVTDLEDVPLGCAYDGVRVGHEYRLLSGHRVPGLRPDGFDSLDAACAALHRAGAGSSAVFEVDGRFIACELEAEWRDPSSRTLRRERLTDIEHRAPGRVELAVRRNTPEARLLRAIVDRGARLLLPKSA